MTEEQPAPGEPVYDEDGELMGRIERVDDAGIRIVPAGEAEEDPTAMAGRGYGEADLVWQCGSCGEIGEIESMPEQCPNCGAGREELYYLTQD